MDKKEFIKESTGFLSNLYDTFTAVPTIELSSLDSDKTTLVIIDMINGFVGEGKLSSPRVFKIDNQVAQLAKRFQTAGIHVLAFADSHSKDSPEFNSYPLHCLSGSRESELTDGLKKVDGIQIIKKNSTNGFLEEEFQEYLKKNPQLDTFVAVGCCTDLCVMLFCLTLKTAFNKINRPCRILVPTELTATFDLPAHNGDFSDISAYFNMSLNGIEIIKNIK